jgi:hypothetical protein
MYVRHLIAQRSQIDLVRVQEVSQDPFDAANDGE